MINGSVGRVACQVARSIFVYGPGGEPNAKRLRCATPRRSGCAAFSPPPSRSFGHGLQRLCRFSVADAGEGDERRSG
jgi:hypothetical protein